MKIKRLLQDGPRVINVGLKDFARDLKDQGVETVEIDWRPPKPQDEEMKRLLEQLL